MPELGNINLVVLLGGPFTMAGFVWLARMFVVYQRDFTDQYRQRMKSQDDRITELESKVSEMEARERRLQLRLMDCQGERQALRATITRAGIPWNPADWNFDDTAE